jgi:divalent metal cation (Fe/Co/Zn/Cd) transporter
MFIDLEVFVDRSLSLESVNALVVEVEHTVRKLVPNSDIVVKTRPTALREVKFADTVRSLASQIHGIRGIHDIAIEDGEGGLHVEMHLEVDPNASLEDAHEISSKLEAAIKSNIPEVVRVATHMEPTEEEQLLRADITSESYQLVRTIRENTLQVSGVKRCGEIEVHSAEDGLHLTVTCVLEQKLSMSDAHTISTQIEERLRKKIRGVSKVLVHVEPDLATD